MSFADAVKAGRERQGWDQSQLARKAGLSPSTISRIEAGDRAHPQGRTVNKIARALGMTADDLWKEAEGPFALIPTVGRVVQLNDVELPVFKAHAGKLNISPQAPIDYFHLRTDELYMVEVFGRCLFELGIEPGDRLIVDRSLTPTGGKVVVCRVHDELLLARWNALNGKVQLTMSDGQVMDLEKSEIVLQGVVIYVMKRGP